MILNETFIPYRKAARYLWKKMLDEGIEFPEIGIVCGSGLSELSNTLEGKTMTVKYGDIPGYVLVGIMLFSYACKARYLTKLPSIQIPCALYRPWSQG
jgi:hypothetical protein